MNESTCGTVSNQKVGHRKRWRRLNKRHSVACFGGDASPFLVRILGGVNIIWRRVVWKSLVRRKQQCYRFFLLIAYRLTWLQHQYQSSIISHLIDVCIGVLHSIEYSGPPVWRNLQTSEPAWKKTRVLLFVTMKWRSDTRTNWKTKWFNISPCGGGYHVFFLMPFFQGGRVGNSQRKSSRERGWGRKNDSRTLG